MFMSDIKLIISGFFSNNTFYLGDLIFLKKFQEGQELFIFILKLYVLYLLNSLKPPCIGGRKEGVEREREKDGLERR